MEQTQKSRLFVDMDGTLAVFRPVSSIEQLYEPGYFRELPPLGSGNVVEGIRAFMAKNPDTEVYILSSVLADHPTVKDEKDAWLNAYLPEIDAAHRLYSSCSKDKTTAVPGGVRPTDTLLDDYSRNLENWRQAGGHGVKLINDINDRGLNGTLWEGERIRYDSDPDQIAAQLSKQPELHQQTIADYMPVSKDRKLTIDELWAERGSAESEPARPSVPTYTLYQLKDIPELRDISFCNLDDLKYRGLAPDPANYEAVYTAPWKGETSEDLWEIFNINRPADYEGRSMSVSDIIVFTGADGKQTAQFADSFGFAEVPEFVKEQPIGQSKQHTPETVGEDRQDELRSLFDNETNDPETEEWRDKLTPEEQKLVDKWDKQFDQGMLNMAQAILDVESESPEPDDEPEQNRHTGRGR